MTEAGRSCRLGAALALLCIAPGCALSYYEDRVERTVCLQCYRVRESRSVRVLGVPVWASRGEAVDTDWSATYDKRIEDEADPHGHRWIPGTALTRRLDLLFRFRRETADAVMHHRTRFALDIVGALGESDPELAREMYGAILSDYFTGRSGVNRRLARLSQAAQEAAAAPDPSAYWRAWWQRNGQRYEQRKRSRGGLPTKRVTAEWETLD
jgi:hypothetical protein